MLRKATGCEEAEEDVSETAETPMGPGVARMQGAMNFFRNYLERGGRRVERPSAPEGGINLIADNGTSEDVP